jgi:hypothetical protein
MQRRLFEERCMSKDSESGIRVSARRHDEEGEEE